jgi:adenylyltransferase/sulfurtransferase
MAFSDEEVERYARHLVLREMGGAGQARLAAARVLIVGAGGLGCPAALYLAAAGVGTLGIVDDDTVSLSNLQRQILFRTQDVGQTKTGAATAALKALNPNVAVEMHTVRLTGANARAIISAYDIVADGSDNFETRLLVQDICFALGRTLVSAAVTEFEGQLATFKPHEGRGVYPCYRCLLPEPPPPGTMQNCSQSGVLGAAAGVMGSLQALEVLKEIAGLGTSLAGRLLLYDALGTRFRTVTLLPDPACRLCGSADKAV